MYIKHIKNTPVPIYSVEEAETKPNTFSKERNSLFRLYVNSFFTVKDSKYIY